MERVMSELPAIFGFRAADSGVALSVKRTGGAEVPALVLSRQGLRQILINLVGNAAKFTKSGEIAVEYGWRAETAETGTLRFAIRDTGCGISGEKMAHLFDPFVQDISSRLQGTEAGTKGTGLGLPIVKRLIDAAGGTIAVRSELGKGTEFSIELPSLCIAKSEEKAAAAIEDVSGEARAPGVPGAVLVVDDIALNRKVLGIHLEHLGVRDVRFADNGLAALAEMRDWTPDCVLTDMWMPEMDGQALAESMHRDPRLAKVPVVAVTADVAVETTHDMRRFARVLAKPITSGKLNALFGELGGAK